MNSTFSKKHLYSLTLTMLLLFSTAAYAALPIDFTSLVKAAGPAVVNVSTERTQEMRGFPGMPNRGPFGNDPFFEHFFDQFDQPNRGQKPQRKSSSLGSGFIISADGYIVTNNHVIEGADSIKITMDENNKGKTYDAEVIGTDPDTDLALLKIDAKNLPTLVFGDSEVLEVGSWVLAIGNPLGLDHTVTAGILSAKGRNIQSGSYDDFLQTDASINPGNSGGPLLNMEGQVIGINTAIAQRAQGIGFAIPSSLAKKVIDDLREHRKVSRGWLGVTIQNVNEATAKALGLKEASGALISNVMEGQPAAKAGIKAGDVILKLNGENIADSDQLTRKVAKLAPSSTVPVIVWREGKEVTLSITVAERDSQQALGKGSPKDTENAAGARLGVSVRPVTPNDVNRLNLSGVSGLFVAGLSGDGLAAESGLLQGDVILTVNNKPVNTAEELIKYVNEAAKANDALLLHVSRKGNVFFVAIDMATKK